MRMFVRLLVAVLALACAGLPARAQGIEGYWYGEDYEQFPGIRTQWLNYRAPDGTFQVEFRRYHNCMLELRQIESGRWFVEGATYTTITEWVDLTRLTPDDIHYVEIYDLVSVEPRTMEYRHERTGILFKARRVGADFEFPACEPMS